MVYSSCAQILQYKFTFFKDSWEMYQPEGWYAEAFQEHMMQKYLSRYTDTPLKAKIFLAPLKKMIN